ncbi:MAG TPA: threonine synthase [Thermodesulfobacteriota bacterium]|nr:threonine synthase [Deltaproteobacteria bacterium]HNR13915.1 threonine synthase [Thermodesulfobacteriota bacterium]HNU72257.1 threonine synthase [Thermodesulfobacteriota bacterium]HQO77625.1 threonine synthase [Thermodesulfobacteriota bacterium]
MQPAQFPSSAPEDLIPSYRAEVVYQCIGCQRTFDIHQFLYTCPECKSLLRIEDTRFSELLKKPGSYWRSVFDYRAMLTRSPLKGIFRYYEFVLPVIPLDDIIYLGEGDTPIIRSNSSLSSFVGTQFYVKNDGLNPSVSFKDRGMASAISFINYLIRKENITELLGICASTGDTSAAAALYLSYLDERIVRSVVLLPHGKVTPAQLSQPLGSGATVIEVPGVFDDCMKIVEELAETYHVCLLNSKNPLRILGQRSYSFEISQQMDYDMEDLVVVVPIGNAGNVTAIMEGFLAFYRAGIIDRLPFIIGVQSTHANPVVQWCTTGTYAPLPVRPSVAQAAMIGNPVSFPKVSQLVQEYFREHFAAIAVSEQEIIEAMLIANRHGHVVCTQGGEAIAGLKAALAQGLLKKNAVVVVDSTSHQLKFMNFQQLYFEDQYPPEYEITPRPELKNKPVLMNASSKEIASFLQLKKKQ